MKSATVGLGGSANQRKLDYTQCADGVAGLQVVADVSAPVPQRGVRCDDLEPSSRLADLAE